MPTIVIASSNPVKRDAALRGFRRMFPDFDWQIEAIEVPSGVSDQPMSDHETLMGATERAVGAANLLPDANYWVGIEGGIDDTDEMAAYAWVVVKSGEQLGKARTGTLYLPPEVARLVRDGKELRAGERRSRSPDRRCHRPNPVLCGSGGPCADTLQESGAIPMTRTGRYPRGATTPRQPRRPIEPEQTGQPT